MNKDKPSEFLNVPLKGVFAYCESDMFDNSDPAKPKTAALVNWNQRYVGAGNVQAWDGNVSAGDNTLTKNWGKVFQAKYPQVKLVNTFS